MLLYNGEVQANKGNVGAKASGNDVAFKGHANLVNISKECFAVVYPTNKQRVP